MIGGTGAGDQLASGNMKMLAANRIRTQVASGDRSDKIRTYNFPQNRLTDHRIGLTIHQLDRIMDGRIDDVIDALIAYYQAEKLKRGDIAA